VRRAGLDRATDWAIWAFAREHDYIIVTLDADFADIAARRGAPPKVIWLRCGNQPTSFFEHLLRDNLTIIADFEQDAEASCFELY
jgi:predicted nuclease of predicted toxin-antitoxin system